MLRFVRSWSAISRSQPQFAPAQRPHARRWLSLERLEDRTVLSTISLAVTSLADSGAGTLRSAIVQADSGSKANAYVINFNLASTYGFGGPILLNSALPSLNNNITINGPGVSSLGYELIDVFQSFNGAPSSSVFVVDSGATVTISGITIQGGYSPGNGGGIDNFGNLTLNDVYFLANFASVAGGGVANESGGNMIVNGVSF